MSARPPVGGERLFGDILVRFHYLKADPNEIGGEHEPAMAITRAVGSGKGRGWFICESAAHLYVSSGKQGGPSSYCVQQSAAIAELLGLTADRRTCFRICELILDCIPDLLQMPPWTPKAVVTGEYEAWMGGTKVTGELKH